MKYIISIFTASLLISSTTNKEKACETVFDFYVWYIDAIHNLPDKEYQPYVEYNDTNKTYSLNIENYCQNLQKHHCSEAFIQRELSNYKQCAESLQNNKHASFEDISDYEDIGCNFLFNYHWLNNDQELVDGIEIIKTESIKEDKLLMSCMFYIVDNQSKKKTYQNYISYITVIKLNETYKIDNIDFDKVMGNVPD
jgi:hypothetical protein